MGNGNASIEFVSENGPIDFSVMMQEGVKALTKILSTHLQDNPDLINEKSMKVIFKDNNGKLEPVFAPSEGNSGLINGNDQDENYDEDRDIEEANEDYEVIEFDNEGNYHVCAKGTQNRAIGYDEKVYSKSEHYADSTDTHDYDEDGIINEDNNQLLPKDKWNGHMTRLKNGAISSAEHEVVFEHDNGDNTTFSPAETINDGHMDKRDRSHMHHSGHSEKTGGSCACQENKDSFKYPDHVPNSAPNFRALLQHTVNGKQMCPFCEYYVVFGTPPAYIMRWASSKISAEHSQYKMNDQIVDGDSGDMDRNLDSVETNEMNKQQTKKKKKKSKRKTKR